MLTINEYNIVEELDDLLETLSKIEHIIEKYDFKDDQIIFIKDLIIDNINLVLHNLTSNHHV